jgi:hypothetical protein
MTIYNYLQWLMLARTKDRIVYFVRDVIGTSKLIFIIIRCETFTKNF